MSANVHAARKALARWERYIAADEAQLRAVEKRAADLRGRLERGRKCAADLLQSLQRYEQLNASDSSLPDDA